MLKEVVIIVESEGSVELTRTEIENLVLDLAGTSPVQYADEVLFRSEFRPKEEFVVKSRRGECGRWFPRSSFLQEGIVTNVVLKEKAIVRTHTLTVV